MKSPLIHFLSALAVLVLAFGGYGIWYSIVSHKSQHVADVQTKIDEATKNVARIASARAALAEIASDEAKVRGYFVPEAGVVGFITTLENLGRSEKTSVNVLSVSTSGTAAQPVLLLTLSIKGTFDGVMRTVGAIEYAPYALFISKLTVAKDDANAWHADLSLTVGSAPSATSTAQTH
jgi:hypothetical protein